MTREMPPAELEGASPTWTTGIRPSEGVSQTVRLGLDTGLLPPGDPGRVGALQVIPAQLIDRAGEDEATTVERSGRLELMVVHMLVPGGLPRDDHGVHALLQQADQGPDPGVRHDDVGFANGLI